MATKITQEEVRHIALLARLTLSPEEEKAFTVELSRILQYMEKLNELHTEGIEPMAHAVEVPTPFREDKPQSSAEAAALLQNAPEREGPFFKVPKILEP